MGDDNRKWQMEGDGKQQTTRALPGADRDVNLADAVARETLTIVVGDRRKLIVQAATDVLHSVGWTDFALINQLPGASGHVVVSDHAYTAQRRSAWFDRPLLIIGAPDVNGAALGANRRALFHLVIDKSAHDRVTENFEKARVDPHFLLTDDAERLRDGLSPLELFDALDDEIRKPRNRHHGVVSLAEHPFKSTSWCVLAAGVSGPTTAGAVALLAGRPIRETHNGKPGWAGLETRPLGGVFVRQDESRQPLPDDVLFVDRDLMWITPRYTIDQLTSSLETKRAGKNRPPHLSAADIAAMLTIVERFRPPMPTARPALTAIVLSGGASTRMADVLAQEGVDNKMSLGIKARALAGAVVEHPVLGWVTRSLAKTGMVDDIEYLTRHAFFGEQEQIAVALSSADVRVAAVDQGAQSLFGAISDRTRSQLSRSRWCLVMMGDTLFTPRMLEQFINKAVMSGAPVSVGCVHVTIASAPEYGVVQSEGGELLGINEKPGLAPGTLVSAGLVLLSPVADSYLREFVRAARSERQTMPDFLNGIAQHVRVRCEVLEGPSFDCGSKAGLDLARAAADRGQFSDLFGEPS